MKSARVHTNAVQSKVPVHPQIALEWQTRTTPTMTVSIVQHRPSLGSNSARGTAQNRRIRLNRSAPQDESRGLSLRNPSTPRLEGGLDSFRDHLKSQPCDGLILGGGLIGDPELSYFMEQIIDATHELRPKETKMHVWTTFATDVQGPSSSAGEAKHLQLSSFRGWRAPLKRP